MAREAPRSAIWGIRGAIPEVETVNFKGGKERPVGSVRMRMDLETFLRKRWMK